MRVMMWDQRHLKLQQQNIGFSELKLQQEIIDLLALILKIQTQQDWNKTDLV